jgi:anti-anti-sigma factor
MDAPDRSLHLTLSLDDGTVHVRAAGEMDMHCVQQFSAAIDEAIASLPSPRGIDVDASALAFVDSSGLRAFLQARTRANGAGIPFRISRRSPRLERLLHLTGLGTLF